MSLIESGLRGFYEETRRSGGGVGGFQLEFRRSVKGDRAQGLRTIPALLNGGRNRLVKGAKRSGRRNLRKKVRSFGGAGSELVQMNLRGVRKIAGGEAVDGFLEIGAGMRRVAAALGIATQPVEGIHSAARDGIFAEEDGHFVVGVRLTLKVSNPSDAPLGVIGVFAAGEILEHALVVVDRSGTVEQDPVIIPTGH